MANNTNNQHDHNHENITLRCNKCGKPITPEEAVLTPTGYRCQDCVRQQQKIFDTSHPLDFVWGLIIAGVVSFLGSLIASLIGFFTVLIAPAAGVAAAEAVRWVTKKRRGNRLFNAVYVGVLLGGLPLIIRQVIIMIAQIGSGSLGLLGLLPLAYRILYVVLAVPSAYYRISGKQR